MALSLSFNRPGTSFVISHDAGFTVYNAEEGVDYQIELPSLGFPVRCAAMMDNHPYVAIAKHMSEEVELWDCRSKSKVHTFCSMPNKQVRSILATTEKVVVVCRATTIIFDSGSAARLAEFETADNDFGLCALGSNRIALPGRTSGQIQVVGLEDSKVRHVFPAHRSGLSAIDVSKDAHYVATANEDGTILRIFALPERALVKQLRRGLDRAAIYSIRMSPDNAFLAATSGNGTLHVFTLAYQPPLDTEQDGQGHKEDSPTNSAKVAATSAISMAGRSSLPPLLSGSPPEDYDLVDEAAPSAPNSAQPAGPKFGVLGKLPFAPSILTDQYSNATMKFDMGARETKNSPQETPGPHPRGQILWIDSSTLIVARVKPSCMWEKFRVRNAVDEWKVERITSKTLFL